MPKGMRPTRTLNPWPTSLSPSREITNIDNEHLLVYIPVTVKIVLDILESGMRRPKQR